jgi:hypothetical protein
MDVVLQREGNPAADMGGAIQRVGVGHGWST